MTTTTSQPSPLIHALDQAMALAMQETATSTIGATRGGPEPTADGTVAYLDGVTSQIAQVQTWLREHPELLAIIDKGIRGEVRQMERRVNIVNVLMNLGFTILGTILGLFLPAVIGLLFH